MSDSPPQEGVLVEAEVRLKGEAIKDAVRALTPFGSVAEIAEAYEQRAISGVDSLLAYIKQLEGELEDEHRAIERAWAERNAETKKAVTAEAQVKQLEGQVDDFNSLGKIERAGRKAAEARLEAAEQERDELEMKLRMLADEAARAVTEPRRFHENEDNRQQALGFAVGVARSALAALAKFSELNNGAENPLRGRSEPND